MRKWIIKNQQLSLNLSRQCLLLLIALGGFVSLDAFAIAPGFYMGLMMGPAVNNGGQQPVQVYPLPTASNPKANTAIANPKSTQFGSRFYLGYKFNTYAGFEMGLDYLSGVNYVLTTPEKPTGGTTLRVRGIDVVGKVDYSFKNTVGVFGKAGVTALYTTTPGALNVTNWHTVTTFNRNKQTYSTQTYTSGSNTYTSKLAPTFSVGVDYDLSQNWQMDASWTRYFVGSVLGSMDLYALGISYHIVDQYCGQFLCN